MTHPHSKNFAFNLNKILDDLEIPSGMRDRAVILGKMLNIPKQQAFAFLEGQEMPSTELLETIAEEFDVEVSWLLSDDE